jgi:hypothetical protein
MNRLPTTSALAALIAAAFTLTACSDSTKPKPPVDMKTGTGSNQSAQVGTAVPVDPTAKVVDDAGNGVAGVTVTWAVALGGGSVANPSSTTNADGVATAGKWLGPTTGSNSLSASVAAINKSVSFGAIGTAGPAAAMSKQLGEGQSAPSGDPVPLSPRVRITDANGNGVPFVAVTFAITGGGGSLVGANATTGSDGSASVGSWTMGAEGTNALTATAAGLAPVTFTAIATAAVPFNLTIDRVHLNQSTQTYEGTVPIVAGRRALARIFVKATKANSVTPAVRLRTYVNGTLFRTYTIAAPTTAVPTEIDETTLGLSWNDEIPANEVVEGMSILADVDPAGTISESSKADNMFPASGTPAPLDVRQVPTMKVTFVPVTQPTVGPGNISESNKIAVLEYAMRVYPFDTLDVVVHAAFAASTNLNGASYDNTWSSLLSSIYTMRIAEGITDRYYYGVAHPGYSAGKTGLGYLGLAAAIGMDFTGTVLPATNFYNMTIAHEWGHNFNRAHVNCGDAGSPDPLYPYDPASSVGTLGYDFANSVLFKPTDMKELMSYCKPVWVSDYTYNAVLSWRATHFAPPPASQRTLLVWGRIGPSGVILEPAYEIDAPPSLPTTTGRYNLQGLDESGRQLFSLSFDGYEVDHAAGERAFAFAVPLATFAGAPAALRLSSGSRELAIRRATPASRSRATVNAAPIESQLAAMSGSRARLTWDAATYPGAMVRDPATGQVLAFLRGGSGEISANRDVDVLFSNGVTSVKERVRIRR